MSDPRRKLAGHWEPSARFSKFGNALVKMDVRGIRAHGNTQIEFRSPITAFAGLNGTGKSTILQLAAACFECPDGFSINDFIRRSRLDQTVFAADAQVKVEYLDQTGTKPLSLTYNKQSSRWQGYGRRPTRTVFYGGVGVFLPRSEQQDFVFRNLNRLSFGTPSPLSAEIRALICQILSAQYADVSENQVSHKTQSDLLLSATRDGNAYSESNMGCGEGRIQSLVRRLESLPEKSLILLEEPEISLHPSAEYALGTYFIDLALRKGHQIVVSTHSSMLLRALPTSSLVFLARVNGQVNPIAGLAAPQAMSLLSNGFDKTLTILVEDEAARLTLTELIRYHNAPFLATVRISIVRDKRPDGKIEASGMDAIRTIMKGLSESGLKVAAVLDGGETADSRNHMYVLPGAAPPERVLIDSPSVKQMLKNRYPLDDGAIALVSATPDPHDVFRVLGQKISCDEEFLIQEAAREFAKDVPASDARLLIAGLMEASHRR